MKKIIIGICIACAVLAAVYIYHFVKNKSENNTIVPENAAHTEVEAKIDGYHSLSEIEDKVNIIVKVIKDSEEPPIIHKGNMGTVNFVGTIGNVKVTKIYTNTSDQNIEVGDILPIFENEAYDSETNTVYHVAGYTKMTIGQEYMLFLTYSSSDRWYVPCSAIWGKYALNDTEAVVYSADDDSEEENIMEKIRLEVLEKYE